MANNVYNPILGWIGTYDIESQLTEVNQTAIEYALGISQIVIELYKV